MKCTNNKLISSLLICCSLLLTACGSKEEIKMPYSLYESGADESVSFSKTDVFAEGFSYDLATFKDDYTDNYTLENAGAGILIDINNKKVLFAQNAFEKMYPASITKVMTALVALKNCSLDENITVTSEALNISDSTAVKLNIKEGDTMTLDQALHLCLINSYNDVAVAIACHVAGSEEAFVELMNSEAEKIGATDTHFSDSCGLGDENHYTSAYDLYMIFNEAINYPEFLEIIGTTDYQTTYYDRNGNSVLGTAKTTNKYLNSLFEMPNNATVVGGKTGTTDEAGYCLCILARDKYSNPYIAIILGADSSDNLYTQMSEMLETITK